MAMEEHTQDCFHVTCRQITNAAHEWEQYSSVHAGSRDSFLWKQAHLVIYLTPFLIAPSSQKPRETSHSSLPPPSIHAQGWLESGRQDEVASPPARGTQASLTSPWALPRAGNAQQVAAYIIQPVVATVTARMKDSRFLG